MNCNTNNVLAVCSEGLLWTMRFENSQGTVFLFYRHKHSCIYSIPHHMTVNYSVTVQAYFTGETILHKRRINFKDATTSELTQTTIWSENNMQGVKIFSSALSGLLWCCYICSGYRKNSQPGCYVCTGRSCRKT